jgi:hypothetical protein
VDFTDLLHIVPRGNVRIGTAMAGVAKWLRQRIVDPPFVGSNPIIRPSKHLSIITLKIDGRNARKAASMGAVIVCTALETFCATAQFWVGRLQRRRDNLGCGQ